MGELNWPAVQVTLRLPDSVNPLRQPKLHESPGGMVEEHPPFVIPVIDFGSNVGRGHSFSRQTPSLREKLAVARQRADMFPDGV